MTAKQQKTLRLKDEEWEQIEALKNELGYDSTAQVVSYLLSERGTDIGNQFSFLSHQLNQTKKMVEIQSEMLGELLYINNINAVLNGKNTGAYRSAEKRVTKAIEKGQIKKFESG